MDRIPHPSFRETLHYGSNLPKRSVSIRGRRPVLPAKDRTPEIARPSRSFRQPNIIGRKMDALGISHSRMAAILACHYRIPARQGAVGEWVAKDGCRPRDPGVAIALATELAIPIAEILAAWDGLPESEAD